MIKNKTYKFDSNKIFFNSLFMLFLSSCATFNTDLIKYNEDKELYEYGASPEDAIILRNQNNELISELNYEAFLEELETVDNDYSHPKLIENANSLKAIDYKIATLYAESVEAINNEKFEDVPNRMEKLESLYPDALYFSNCSFLNAYALEKMGKPDDAKEKYLEYLTFSSGKFTERFRGYRNSDLQDSTWIQQRNYARDYVSENTLEIDSSFFSPFIPKYYYSSFHPGYSINPEDYKDKTKHIFMFVLGLDISNNIAFGVQYYRPINKYFDINPRYNTSGAVRDIGMAVPIKLYKSVDNKFALKLSPFFTYSRIKELNFDDTTWEMDDNIFDFGIKASAGYYLAPKLSLGVSYSLHRYNENNKYLSDNHGIEIWYFNEYDVSFYYDLFKGFSLKSGIKDGDFVAGVYWSGWEISYNINESKFIFRIDMY